MTINLQKLLSILKTATFYIVYICKYIWSIIKGNKEKKNPIKMIEQWNEHCSRKFRCFKIMEILRRENLKNQRDSPRWRRKIYFST